MMISKTISIIDGKICVTITDIGESAPITFVHNSGAFRIAQVTGGCTMSLNRHYTSISIDRALLPFTGVSHRQYDGPTLTLWAEDLERYFADYDQGVNEYVPQTVERPTLPTSN